MSLITCPECKNEISSHAPSCPKCGLQITPSVLEYVRAKEYNEKKVALISLFLIIGSIGVIVGLSHTPSNQTTSNTPPNPVTTLPDESEPTLSSTSSTASSPAPPQSVALSTWANITKERAIKVNSSAVVAQIPLEQEYFPDIESIKPVRSKGGKLVVIYMSLKNTGQESGNMFWSKFNLVDNQGRKYDEIEDFEEVVSINTWLKSHRYGEAAGATGDQLFPGATAETAKVFRVAPDADGLKLTINNVTLNI